MKKILFTLSLALLVACGGNVQKNNEEKSNVDSVQVKNDSVAHNAKNSLDVDGVYVGELPMASKGPMTVTVTLTGDSYTRVVGLPDAKTTPSIDQGKIKWNDAGNTITLEGAKNDLSNLYFVGEDKLIQLDKEGKKFEGATAEAYILAKQ